VKAAKAETDKESQRVGPENRPTGVVSPDEGGCR